MQNIRHTSIAASHAVETKECRHPSACQHTPTALVPLDLDVQGTRAAHTSLYDSSSGDRGGVLWRRSCRCLFQVLVRLYQYLEDPCVPGSRASPRLSQGLSVLAAERKDRSDLFSHSMHHMAPTSLDMNSDSYSCHFDMSSPCLHDVS